MSEQLTLMSMFGLQEEKKTVKEVKKEETKSSTSNEKSSLKTSKTENSQVDSIKAKLKNYVKVELKVFGSQVKVFEGEDIENIDLKSLQDELVSLGYGEFSESILWTVAEVSKTEAILVAGCKFFNKG
ncbi:hypothetical protein [Clostridium perfringens]|uniref:Uncharacterized protein n=2 Tax=Clostridium perfringens TaxID=1502 RepID=A0A8H9UXV6_CLOPF|nr:hypothetical protein [Clostridium perfringens]MDU7143478.1 hypothetical protein [Anaerococcus vaginalis]MDU7977687.1 hypothetical protein [Clostridioides difficile]EDT15812.1 hypothetical protein AC3_A0107 [Clostridium perfringens E str. JGS1987]MBI6024915.1 hypothetical protein [Clostridium perfringens]MBI6048742.1 hypothetical protein [Clostridium perfringens]